MILAWLAGAMTAAIGLCGVLWLVLPRPSGFSPWRAWGATKRRRQAVLWKMRTDKESGE